MQYINIKNLEKYLPGYTDRTFAWLKLYFRDTTDPETKVKRIGIFNDTTLMELDEIDRYRFFSLACMQGFLGKPVPLDARNMTWMGWNLKKRSKDKTIQMLHSFIEVSGEDVTQIKSRIRVEKNKSREEYSQEFLLFWKEYPIRWVKTSDTKVKVGKHLAWEQWQKIDIETRKQILKIVPVFAAKIDSPSVPDAWRWLRDKKYLDYAAEPAPAPKPKGKTWEEEHEGMLSERYKAMDVEKLRRTYKHGHLSFFEKKLIEKVRPEILKEK